MSTNHPPSRDPMEMMANAEELPERKSDFPSPSAEEIQRWWNSPVRPPERRR